MQLNTFLNVCYYHYFINITSSIMPYYKTIVRLSAGVDFWLSYYNFSFFRPFISSRLIVAYILCDFFSHGLLSMMKCLVYYSNKFTLSTGKIHRCYIVVSPHHLPSLFNSKLIVYRGISAANKASWDHIDVQTCKHRTAVALTLLTPEPITQYNYCW